MTGCTVIRCEQLETYPETIEQELRPAVCERRQTDYNYSIDDKRTHIIGITESRANNYIAYAELGLVGYVMFRKDIMGRRGGGVLI